MRSLRVSSPKSSRLRCSWIEASFELAKRDVYVPPIGVGPGPFAMTEAYKSKALEVARRRVALAGARLANLLNEALK